jgi:hypothetical protein
MKSSADWPQLEWPANVRSIRGKPQPSS